MRKICLFITALIVLSCSTFKTEAQNYVPDYHDHHFYFHVEMSTGNIYPLAAWSILSGLINSSIDYNMCESEFAYDLYTGDEFETKYYSPLGFTATELFNHVQPSIKLGYYSDYIQSPFNWGLLATVGYKLNQFEMGENDQYCKQSIQRLQLGGLFMLSFGRNGGNTQSLIELGLKYNVAVKYKGGNITDTEALNNGLTSHFALKFGGSGWLQNIGVFADIDHYDLFNKSFKVGGEMPYQYNNLKNITVGVCLTLTPAQVDKRRNK